MTGNIPTEDREGEDYLPAVLIIYLCALKPESPPFELPLVGLSWDPEHSAKVSVSIVFDSSFRVFVEQIIEQRRETEGSNLSHYVGAFTESSPNLSIAFSTGKKLTDNELDEDQRFVDPPLIILY